jgi:hypothetical protein
MACNRAQMSPLVPGNLTAGNPELRAADFQLPDRTPAPAGDELRRATAILAVPPARAGTPVARFGEVSGEEDA